MKNRLILNIIELLYFFLFTSCFGGVPYADLGNNYAWIESDEIVKITGFGDNALYYEVIIRPQVVNFDDDDRYIVAYQVYGSLTRAYYSVTSEKEDSILIQYEHIKDGVLTKVPQPDSIVAQYEKIKELKKCYWIIDKKTDKVMGPMTKEEFDRQCKALHVKAKMKKSHEQTIYP